MSTRVDLENEQSIGTEIKLSVILHVLIFAFFAVRAIFFPSNLDLLENAIRVDMVALPDKIDPNPLAGPITPETPKPVVEEKKKDLPAKEEPPKLAVKEIPKQTEAKKDIVKEPDAIKIEKDKATQKQALAKLKQLDAFEKLEKQLETEKKQQAVQAAAQAAVKGNILSPGSELKGINQLQADNYRGVVQRHMKQHWEIPHYIKKTNLETEVLVKFDTNGLILSKEIIKSSGNAAYDEAVMAAIEKSSPVPAPPGKFTAIASVEGFTFVFKPDQ